MSFPQLKGQVNQIQNNGDNYLLTNIMKTWIDEDLNKNNTKETNIINYDKIIDNTIIKNSNINYDNLPNWPKRSPFEFYNKDVIIPEDYKLSTVNNNNEKLNPIKDDLNPYSSKNKTESDNNDKEVKISLIYPNINNNNETDNNILINKIPEKENNIEENNIEEDNINIEKNNLEENHNKNNDKKNDFSFEEQDNEYKFGNEKEGKLEPIKLSLIRDTIGDDEEKISQFHNQIEKEKYEQSLKDNYLNNIKNPNQKLTNLYNYRNDYNELKKKKRILTKTEKELEYFKEKDLFDEEIDDENFNITQQQMNMLDKETNKNYNYFKEALKKKNFEINHPYLDYEKFLQNENQSIDNHLSISQKNELKQIRLKPIIYKQKTIINNIILKKQNLNSHNSMNNIYSNNKILNNNNSSSSSSIFVNNTIEQNYRNNQKKNNTLNYRVYSIKDYRSKYKNEKIGKFGGLGANIGGEEWTKRQNLLERKKEYSNYIIFNEKRNLEEKKSYPYKGKLIKKIKINNENNNSDELKDIIDDKKDLKFPLIKSKISKNNIINNDNLNKKEKKIYINSFLPLKKYKIKKETEDEKFNKIIGNNPKLDILFKNHNMYNIRFEKIKSHIK